MQPNDQKLIFPLLCDEDGEEIQDFYRSNMIIEEFSVG